MPLTGTTLIDLMRHGEPRGGRRYRGQSDDPLSERGWQQMRDAVGDHRPWNAIVSSPLCRCADFAREIAARHALPLSFEERFKEIGFGEWEGKTPEELTADDPDRLIRFWRAPLDHVPPGAEPLDLFGARVAAAWQEMLQRHAGSHLLVVAHAGVVRAVVREALSAPPESSFRIDVPYAGITRIRVDRYGELSWPRLVFHAGALV